MRKSLLIALVLAVTLCACEVGATGASPENKYDSLKRFSQVLDLVEKYYVKEVPRKDVIDGAIKGMLQSLDPHSTFMSPDDFKRLQETTAGEFFGIGIEMAMENDQLVVITPIEDTPAFRAGIKSGDLIISVDGKPTMEMSSQEAASMIRGAKGTPVELSILPKGGTSPRPVKLIRDAIPLISVKERPLGDGYHWLRLTRFSDRSTEELEEALESIKKKGEVKGIILDLRNNPGGPLEQAINVSDLFLQDGVIVSIKGRQNGLNEEYRATKEATDTMVPMVILVNAGSASAAEIVAGALRDNKRAVLVGERTFGKGSVQNVIPMNDGSGLKLTVAFYYTPDGRSIQAEGIQPDFEIPFEVPQENAKDQNWLQFREQNLSRHLENANAKETPKEKQENEETAKYLALDNQLRMAVQLLKGLPRLHEIQ